MLCHRNLTKLDTLTLLSSDCRARALKLSKRQDFAQNPEYFARLHDREIVTFGNSAPQLGKSNHLPWFLPSLKKRSKEGKGKDPKNQLVAA